MRVYDTYGIAHRDIRTVANRLEEVFGIKWELRESSFIGEYYFSGSLGLGESFQLESNFNEAEGDWYEPEFKHYVLLLRVNLSKRYKEIESLLENSSLEKVLIRRTMIDQ